MKHLNQTVSILILFVFLVIGCKDVNKNSNTSTNSAPLMEKLVSVKATEIAYSYSRNEVRADQAYGGSTWLISGKIESIGKTFTGAPYVIISGNTATSSNPSYVDVQIVFKSSEIDKIAKLGPGDEIKAKATCDGLSLGNVILSDAELR